MSAVGGTGGLWELEGWRGAGGATTTSFLALSASRAVCGGGSSGTLIRGLWVGI